MAEPEAYYFSQTPYVPNSKLPVLVYRDVLPRPHDEGTARHFLESNNWRKGGAWGAVPRHHFHPNTHECYAVLRGSSTLLLGIGPLENQASGQEILVTSGDVIILPAGVSHCSKEFEGDYAYLGVYPMDSPKWRNEYCKDWVVCQQLREEAQRVPVPEWDPVCGFQGPLYQLWT